MKAKAKPGPKPKGRSTITAKTAPGAPKDLQPDERSLLISLLLREPKCSREVWAARLEREGFVMLVKKGLICNDYKLTDKGRIVAQGLL